jgi:hypothetical protein
MKLIKAIYHQFLKIVLRLCGMDFAWYQNFYVKWPYAVPVVEVLIQKFRPGSRSVRYFARYDISRFARPGDTVPVRFIADILDSPGFVPLIKMDIEGAEYDVLDDLLLPENLDKFGLCLVECHAGKIPALEPRHRKIESVIDRLDLRDRVFLDWD